MRKTKPRKRVQVASRISNALKISLDMWAHSQRITNSEAIRIGIENLVLPEAQKSVVVTLLHEIAGTQSLILKQLQSFGNMRNELEQVGELVAASMQVSAYFDQEGEIGDILAEKDVEERYKSLLKLTHSRYEKGKLFQDLEKEKRKPL